MPDPGQGVVVGIVLWLATYAVHSSVALLLAEAAHRLGWLRGPERADLIWKLALLVGVVTATGATVRTGGDSFDLVAGHSASQTVERAHFSMDRSLERPLHDRLEISATPAPPFIGTDAPSDEFDAGAAVVRWSGSPVGPGMSAVGAVGARGPRDDVAIRTVRAHVVSPSPACRAAVRAEVPAGPGWVDRMESECLTTAGDGYPAGLLAVWLAGALASLIVLLQGQRAVTRLRDGLEPAGPGALGVLEQVARGTGFAPAVMKSREVDAPCVLDRRTIVLPEQCEQELRPDELNAVLAHELAHVARADTAWLALARVVAALFWFQPLNRLACRRMMAASELIADDWALARTGQRLGLARSISRVAEWSVAARTPGMAVAFARGDRGTLSTRVARVLDGGGTPHSSRVGRLLLGGLLVLPLLMLPEVPAPAESMVAVFVEQDADLALIEGSEMGTRAVTHRRAIRLTIDARGVDPTP